MSQLVPPLGGLSMRENAEKQAEEDKSLDAFTSLVEESSILRNNPNKRYYIDPVGNTLMKVVVIGSPNCGKSSLYNLLTRAYHTHRMSLVENAIFTTIDPFIATYTPYDERMEMFQKVYPQASEVIPVQWTVIDTPAVIAGAFKDKKGLGIQGIESVYNCDVVIHLIRGFDHLQHAHYHDDYHPLRDLQEVEQELMLKDMQKIEKQLIDLEYILVMDDHANQSEHMLFLHDLFIRLWEFLAGEKRPKQPNKSKFKMQKNLYRTKMPKICKGLPIRLGKWNTLERDTISTFKLLTSKEVIYAYNMTSMEYLRRRKTKEMIAIEEYLTSREDPCVLFPLSIEYEQHLYEIEHSGGPEALREYFQANGTQVSAMRTIIQQLYDTLNLITYYTITIQSNQREGTEFIQLKAWLFRQGLTAQEAANRKDVRISRKFIRMEVIPFFEYKAFDGDQLKLRMEGKVRQEGRKYIVNDGDIVEFFHHPL